ncbi:MAG: choice-of-anchor B family protein [Saprospiraceae bacterium]
MKKYLFLLLLSISFIQINAQVAFNMELLGHYDDNTIPSADGSDQKVFNDIWGYAANDREYAIVGSAAYIHFFDVTEPQNPILIDQILGTDTTVWRDIKVYGNYAYAVSEGNGEGLMIFDLSDLPNSVSLVNRNLDFFEKAHNIFIDENGKMFAAGTNTVNNGLIVLDLTADPTQPQMIGNSSLAGGGYVHDVYVKDNLAYCSHGWNGYYVWDYTDPAIPVLKANLATNGYNHSSWLSEDGTYAIFAEEVPQGLPLGIADLSMLDNGSIELAGDYFQFPLLTFDSSFNTPHNPFIKGNYAFISYYEDGVQVIDLTDKTNPTLAGYYDTFPNNVNYAGYFGCWGVYPFLPSGNIIASDRKYGLHILNFDETLSSNENLISNNTFTIFPNPSTNGVFNIRMDEVTNEKMTIEVTDLSGRNMFQQVLTSSSEMIDLSFLANGFYFGKVRIGEKEMVEKLVISK